MSSLQESKPIAVAKQRTVLMVKQKLGMIETLQKRGFSKKLAMDLGF